MKTREAVTLKVEEIFYGSIAPTTDFYSDSGIHQLRNENLGRWQHGSDTGILGVWGPKGSQSTVDSWLCTEKNPNASQHRI